MKYLSLISLIFVASCASHPQLVVRPAPPPAIEPIAAVRYGEGVRAYQIGRYIDPNHAETMHERHSVYRVEAGAQWNLHPGAITTANILNPPPNAAFAPPPASDALAAEMNRQQRVTEQVMKEAARLAASYSELQKVFEEMKAVARNNALLGARLATAEQRVEEVEKEFQRLAVPSTSATNDVPASGRELPDAPNK